MAPRIDEQPLGPAALTAYTVRRVGVGLASAGLAGFLLGLGATLTVLEAFPRLPLEVGFDVDSFSRVLVPFMFCLAVLGGGVMAVGDSALNWCLGRQLAARAETEPESVPPRWQRAAVLGDSPLTGLQGLLWVLAGLAALAVLVLALVIGETSDDELGSIVTALVVALVVGAGSVVAALRVGSRGAARWQELTATAREVWTPRAVSAAEARDRSRRRAGVDAPRPGRGHRLVARAGRRTLLAATTLVFAGAAAGFGGVMFRQPCRYCDPVQHGPFGEGTIDVLIVLGAVLALVGLVLLVVATVALTLAGAAGERLLRRSLTQPEPGTPPPGVILRDFLHSPSLLDRTGVALVGVGSAALTGGLSVAVNGLALPAPTLDALLWGGAALVPLGALLVVVAVDRAVRLRSALRERWSAADELPPRKKPRRRR